MVSKRSLSESQSPQVSRTFLSILADLNNGVIWMVSTRPPVSKSSSPSTNPFGIVPSALITIGITVTIMFHIFFFVLSQGLGIYLSLHFPLFLLCGLSAGSFFFVVDFRVFAKGQGDRSSIPHRVVSKTQKMVLDTSLPNTQIYKVWIKGKVEQSRERSSALPLKRELSGPLRLWSQTLLFPVGLVVWPKLGDPFVSRKSQRKNFVHLIFSNEFRVVKIPLVRMAKFQFLAQFQVFYYYYY